MASAAATPTTVAGVDQFAVRGTVAWVQIPVAHLSFETDIHFSIIHCFIPN
jgi:hypothetical protein